MRLFQCSFSAVILCVIYWQDSAAETNSTKTQAPQPNHPNEIEINNPPVTHPFEFVSIKKLILRNSTGLRKGSGTNFTLEIAPNSKRPTADFKVGPNLEKKREIENGTFDPFKSLFLFPILPFLFPPKDDGLVPPDTNELSEVKNDTNADVSQALTKPFIFFDFAFNLRQIPLKNETDAANDSKIINVKRFKSDKANSKKKSKKRKRSVPDFFDDAPLFPNSEFDEFLPKPDLFFPDLSLHPKPVKKLARSKRDEKKPDGENNFKFFLDAFDDAFTRTQKEIERTNPILNFFKGMESSFGEEKKDADDFFDDASYDAQDNSNVKWKVQRNVKRLNDDHSDVLAKSPESPMIILDKVVKIGEFRLHDDKLDAKKSKRKKKRGADPKRKSLEEKVSSGKHIFDTLHREQSKETKKWKRNHHPKGKGQIFARIESKEIKLLPSANTSYVSSNGTDESLTSGNLSKMIDSLEETLKADFAEGWGKFKRNTAEKKASYDDLKKNVTEVLNRFLGLVKEMDKVDSTESPQDGEQSPDDERMFDWTKNEILESLGARRKKEVEFPMEYVDDETKGRRLADLNFLFMTVTLPTVSVFALVLFVCFLSLRVKGKICTKLFNPRQVYVMEDEVSSSNKPVTKDTKAQNI